MLGVGELVIILIIALVVFGPMLLKARKQRATVYHLSLD